MHMIKTNGNKRRSLREVLMNPTDDEIKQINKARLVVNATMIAGLIDLGYSDDEIKDFLNGKFNEGPEIPEELFIDAVE